MVLYSALSILLSHSRRGVARLLFKTALVQVFAAVDDPLEVALEILQAVVCQEAQGARGEGDHGGDGALEQRGRVQDGAVAAQAHHEVHMLVQPVKETGIPSAVAPSQMTDTISAHPKSRAQEQRGRVQDGAVAAQVHYEVHMLVQPVKGIGVPSAVAL